MGIVDKQQQIQALKAAVDKRNSDNRYFLYIIARI